MLFVIIVDSLSWGSIKILAFLIELCWVGFMNCMIPNVDVFLVGLLLILL
jgi:hypothetical protein